MALLSTMQKCMQNLLEDIVCGAHGGEPIMAPTCVRLGKKNCRLRWTIPFATQTLKWFRAWKMRAGHSMAWSLEPCCLTLDFLKNLMIESSVVSWDGK